MMKASRIKKKKVFFFSYLNFWSISRDLLHSLAEGATSTEVRLIWEN